MSIDARIMPGDVYMYSCGNDQGYGYMVPVKTSNGWDLIDTYQLDIPLRKAGETSDAASVRRVIELGRGEHDGYVGRAASSFYHRNARFGKESVPDGLSLVLNLGDYAPASPRECEDYDEADVAWYVPLYHEQHFDWDSGRTLGLCFVRNGAKKSLVAEFRSLLSEASGSIVEPCAGRAAFLLGKAREKLCELEAAGLATKSCEADVGYLASRAEIIDECVEKLRSVRNEYIAQLDAMSGAGEDREGDDDGD